MFNEFSSGARDAMAYRRLCKMFYDRGDSGDGHKLGYLLLMGCGNFDNRQIDVKHEALNYPSLLTWQTVASDNDNNSITTDDFFGILADGTRATRSEEGCDHDEVMNIAVGRMIVKNVSEARTVVNKLVKYVTKPDYGSWKNQVMLVADDEEKGMFMERYVCLHAKQRRRGYHGQLCIHRCLQCCERGRRPCLPRCPQQAVHYVKRGRLVVELHGSCQYPELDRRGLVDAL